MEITRLEEYEAAIERANQLRADGADAEHCAELASLDAAIHAYAAKPQPPRHRPGKPAPSPLPES